MFEEEFREHILRIIRGNKLKEIIGMLLLKQRAPIRMIFDPKEKVVIVGIDPNPLKVGVYNDPRDFLEEKFYLKDYEECELVNLLMNRWQRFELSNLRSNTINACNFEFLLSIYEALDTRQDHLIDTSFIYDKGGQREYRLVVDGYQKHVSIVEVTKIGIKPIETVQPFRKNKHRLMAGLIKRWMTMFNGKGGRVDISQSFYQYIEDKYFKKDNSEEEGQND